MPSCRSDSRVMLLIRAAVAPVVKPLAEATRLDIDAGLLKRRLRMHIMQSRRDLLTTLSAAAAAGVLGARASLADEGPPETTTIRLGKLADICLAPQYVAEELLRAEGFTDIRYVESEGGTPCSTRSRVAKWTSTAMFAAVLVAASGCRPAAHGGGGRPSRVLRAVRARADPNHQRPEGQEGRHPGARLERRHVLVAIMAAQVGLDPDKDIDWVAESIGRRRWSCSPRARSTRFSAFRPSRRSCAPAGSVT